MMLWESVCLTLESTGRNPEIIIEMVRNAFGLDLSEDWLNELGRKVIKAELLFNRAAGLTKEDDRIPAYFAEETVRANPKHLECIPGRN